ncbi:MAG: ROK family protein [Ktedonobacteraceae bacterium]|nr:ROK family protein [Ktedonobacteraceae bacterium]
MSRDRSVAVGVEIGAGRTAVALIDRHGRIRHRCEAKTLRGRPASATLEPYLRAIDATLERAHSDRLPVCGIGVSLPGTLDPVTRRPLGVSLLPSLNNFPLCEFLEMRYRLPVQMQVDVDAALLGEHYFGAGRGFRRLLLLTVNAVVGAALIRDGQLERTENYTGHICHIPLSTSANGTRCSCGRRGCINTLVSMDAIQKMVQRALRRGDETHFTQRLLSRESFSPQLLAEEARHGDSVALQIYSEAGRWLGMAVNKYMDLFEPDILILGSEVLCASDVLLPHIRNALDGNSRARSSRVCSLVEVVPACLASDAELIGAVVPLF